MRQIEIEELKRLELDILDFFVDVCNKNQLSYFLSGGTLLGSIRHKGFIPWDDDMDVGMPRCAYNEFIKNAQKILPPYLEIRFYKNTREVLNHL